MRKSATALGASAVLAAATFFATAVQAATVIEFDEFSHTSAAKLHGNVLSSNGYTFTTPGGQGFASWGMASPNNGDPGGATLLSWNSAAVTMARADGAMFSLESLDLGDFYNVGSPNTLRFSFFDGRRTTTTDVVLDRAKGLETVSFGGRNIQWFSFNGLKDNVSAQFDNLVVGAPVVSGVPEPATWAMMILGFGAVGSAVRSRRRRDLTAWA